MKTPCFVITRDRMSLTHRCVSSLSVYSDLIDIHLVDHGSTYGPMLDYLDASPYPVHWRGNCMPRSLWRWQTLDEIVGDEYYLVTDPDIVLDDDCPADWLEKLNDQLNRIDRPVKAGMGIRINDLPKNEMGMKVKRWESRFWDWLQPDKMSYRAPVDTTLALYPPLPEYPDFNLVPAVRMAPPYLIRHLPWYEDWYDEEAVYYRERILSGSSHWNVRSW